MRFGIRMLGITGIIFGACGISLKNAHPQLAADSRATPLILEKSEGEHRVRRPRETPVPTGPFTIKIDRKNGGSQKMFVGTEEIPAGGLIPGAFPSMLSLNKNKKNVPPVGGTFFAKRLLR